MNATESQPRRSHIGLAIGLAALQLGGALLLSLARKQGHIDAETTTRGVMVLIGLSTAAWGNMIPKMLGGPQPGSVTAAAVRQHVLRFTGWALTLFGLLFAALYAFAARELAVTLSVASGLIMIAAVFAYTLRQKSRYARIEAGQ